MFLSLQIGHTLDILTCLCLVFIDLYGRKCCNLDWLRLDIYKEGSHSDDVLVWWSKIATYNMAEVLLWYILGLVGWIFARYG